MAGLKLEILAGAGAVAIITAFALGGCGGGGEPSAFTERIEAADELFRSRQYEEAGKLFEQIATDADESGDTAAYVEACAMRARSYLITGCKDEGRPWIEQAAARANARMPQVWSRYLGVRGRFEWQDNDNETATRTFKDMYDYCTRHELYSRAVDAAHMVAITGDESEKFDWSYKGIEAAEAGEMTSWLGPLWNNLGWNYYDAERYEEALEALEKAKEYHYMGEQALPRLIADYSVGHVHRVMGHTDEAEAILGPVFDWAVRLHSEEKNPDALEWVALCRWEKGELAAMKGDAKGGLALLEEAAAELEQAGMPKWDESGWKKKQARIEELKGLK